MKTAQTQTIQQFGWDGPISMATIVALAIALLGLFAWTLYREQRILGRRTTIGFGLLRTIAIGTVLWMLLSPMQTIVQTSSTRQTVAIMTDVSGSMSVTDPPDTADQFRWTVASIDAAAPPVTVLADRAVAAVGIARRNTELAMKALNDHLGDRRVTEHLLQVQTALTRANAHVQTMDPLSRRSSPEDSRWDLIDDQLRTTQQMFRSAELQSFDELVTILAKDKTPPQPGWRESLPDLQARLGQLHRLLSELATTLAAIETMSDYVASGNPETTGTPRPRLHQVSQFTRHLKRATLNPLANQVDVQWSRFDEALQPVPDHETLHRQLVQLTSASNDAAATNLSAALEHLRRLKERQPIAAAFVLSDVAHNETGQRGKPDEDLDEAGKTSRLTTVRAPLEVAATLDSTPVYLVPIGNDIRQRDLQVLAVEAPPVAMRNDKIVIEAHVEAHRAVGERCVVQLIEQSEVVDFREVMLDADFVSRTVRFERQVPEIGEQTFEVAIQPIDGEWTDQNNREFVDVNVTRNDIKVLLADELPRWEYRYLTQLFRRDGKIDCDELLFRPRLVATGHRQQSQSLPKTVDQWDRYDVVILGDLGPDRLDSQSQASLIQYLRQRGGTLITIAGSRAMPQSYIDQPLFEGIPVVSADDAADPLPPAAGYAFQVTAEGQSHVALMIGETQQATHAAWEFVNQFAPLHAISPWCIPKPTAKSLIAAVPRLATSELTDDTSDTFLCWQPLGRGRVVYLAGPDTYRLRFLRGDQLHHRFWGQLLRWAIASDMAGGSKLVRLRMTKSRYQIPETVRGEVELSDDEGLPLRHASDLALKLSTANQQRSVPLVEDPQRPGTYVAEFTASEPGSYSATPVGPLIETLQSTASDPVAEAAFTVQTDLPDELMDTRSNRVLAGQIADVTGGQVVPPTAVSEILALSDLDPIVTQTVQRVPLWAQWKYLWLVFGCLQLEWTVRRWRGLS